MPKKRTARTAPGIGDRIRRARIRNKLSQAALAEMISVDQSAVAHWEAGRREPRYGLLATIASALGIALSRLVENGS